VRSNPARKRFGFGERLGLHLDPPKVGEHTEELLQNLGLDIADLKSKGAI
tara:strand:+ start:314 stop:463 length:150 start_codon:yes stop_codon:yes gene_type:complete